MADTKISGLTALAGSGVDASADVLPIVDTNVSTTKKISYQGMMDAINTLTELNSASLSAAADFIPIFNVQDSKAKKLGVDDLAVQLPARKNAIINGDFSVAQRGTSFTSATTPANSDDTYLLDRWYVLSDGNDIVDVTQETSVIPTGGLYAIALDVETANKKFGIAQIIEQKNCKGFIGNTCTLSFKAKVSATTNLDNVKAAIIAWSSTADSVTSDVVSAWGIEGTNPTLAANLTYENTPANLSLTTSYATYSVSAAIDTASTTNIVLFIWSDVTTTSVGGADILYITDVQLERGSVATEFEYRTFQDELALCERYYEKSFVYGTVPAQSAGTNTGEHIFIAGVAGATGTFSATVPYVVRKRATPTVTFYNPAAANGEVRNESGGADCSGTAIVNSTDRGFYIFTIGDAGCATTSALGLHWAAVSEL